MAKLSRSSKLDPFVLELARRRESLVSRANFGVSPVSDYQKVAHDILSKCIMPYQLEIHPGRLAGGKICWMECPYCYGVSASNSSKRLSKERFLEIVRQTASGPHGKIPRLIYTGHATDPLYCEYIDDLIAQTIANEQVFGIYSKLLKISDEMIESLVGSDVLETSYINISVDAGCAGSYNRVHGLKSNADVLGKVLRNIKRLTSRRTLNSRLDICTTYLVTEHNNSDDEIKRAIENIVEAGADTLRFNFAQAPRGYVQLSDQILPVRENEEQIFERIRAVIESVPVESCRVTVMAREVGRETSAFQVMPCVARFLTPTIGFDGHLYHCSESAAPDFHSNSLGDLDVVDFWEAYYGYASNDMAVELSESYARMKDLSCHCNRECYRNNIDFKSDSFALKLLGLIE